MGIKKKQLQNRWLCTICMLILWSGCIIAGIFVNGFSMKEPVFIQNYLEVALYDDYEFEAQKASFHLYYIADESFSSSVADINFDTDLPLISNVTEYQSTEHSIFTLAQEETSYKRIGHYQLHTVYVTLQRIPQSETNVILTDAEITFKNGEKQKVHLNHINLVKQDNMENGLKIVHSSGSYTSQIHKNCISTVYFARHPFTIVDIKTDTFIDAGIDVRIRIDGKEYTYEQLKNTEFSVNEDDSVTIELVYYEGQVNQAVQNVSIRTYITYRNENGDEIQESMSAIGINPKFNDEWKLKEYLRGLSDGT